MTVFALLLYTAAWSQTFGPYGSTTDCDKVAELAGAVKTGQARKVGNNGLLYSCIAISGKQKEAKAPAPATVKTVPVPPPAEGTVPAPEAPKTP